MKKKAKKRDHNPVAVTLTTAERKELRKKAQALKTTISGLLRQALELPPVKRGRPKNSA